MAKRIREPEIPHALFCDASYLIAFFASADQYHARAVKIANRLKGEPLRLITSWPTLSEASTLLLYHYGYSHSLALLQSLRTFDIITPVEEEYDDALALFKKLNKDKKLSFNDLMIFTLVRNRLKNIPVLSFDDDLAKVGLTIFLP